MAVQHHNGAIEIDRVKSGVPGLDELIYGGIPRANLVVLSGDPGSGKTVMCWQFIYEGITQFGENAVYISLEESEQVIFQGAKEFSWDFEKLVKESKLVIITVELYDFERLKVAIEDNVKAINAKRLIIDPGVIFRLFFDRELDARKRIVALGKMLRTLDVTTIITNEISLERESSLYGLEEYVADGVILLYHTRLKNRFVRSIAVLKMRNTEIMETLKPLKITSDGVKILAKAELFDEVT
ncbi:Putative flagella-related protein H [uncultured archaeon]|nr:Putative flagella-related protein H [uncultured archaeon]